MVAGGHRPGQDVVQVLLRAATERIADVPPVDRQDPHDGCASGLRPITPMVGVV